MRSITFLANTMYKCFSGFQPGFLRLVDEDGRVYGEVRGLCSMNQRGGKRLRLEAIIVSRVSGFVSVNVLDLWNCVAGCLLT